MGRPRKWTTPLQQVTFRVEAAYYPRILAVAEADNAPSLQAWLHGLVVARVTKVARQQAIVEKAQWSEPEFANTSSTAEYMRRIRGGEA